MKKPTNLPTKAKLGFIEQKIKALLKENMKLKRENSKLKSLSFSK